MWQKLVQTWLTHSAISNLQLYPISDRFNDPRIRSFLEESHLSDGGGSAMPGRRLRLDTMAASGDPRGARRGGRPRLWPMVESAAQQQQLLAAAADARPAPAAVGMPAQGGISAPPPSALPLPPSPAAGRVGLMGAAAQPLANGLWPPAGGQRTLLPQLAANWPPPGGWPGGHGLPPWACRLPAYGGGGSGGWADSPAAMPGCRIRAIARWGRREDPLRRGDHRRQAAQSCHKR
jgi:hypothetical protein